MNEKLPLWPLKMGEGRQYTLEESHELSSCTGKLGNLTLEDDGSCGHLSLNKTVRSIDKLLINVNPVGSAIESHPSAWSRVVAVNLSGPFLMARAVMEHMLAHRWGRIIGVTTSLDTMFVLGHRSRPDQ